MAECRRFVCTHCHRTVEAWSDGNPYYLDETGAKQYAYHPDDRLARCIGNDSPHMCMSCGGEFTVDSRAPFLVCPRCGQADLAATTDVLGRRCPSCGTGAFRQDPDFLCIS